MDIRCPTCLRTERRLDGEVTVLDPGGVRTPPPPRLAAEWRAVREALAAGEGMLGPCAGCGMPLSAPGGTGRFALSLPDGELIAEARSLYAAGAPVEAAEVEARVQAALPRESAAVGLYRGALFTWLVVPLILWACAFFCFATFLCVGVPQGAEFMPR